VLRDVVRGDDDLGERHVVIGDEDDLEEVADLCVAVDDAADRVDEADDALRHVVARRRLAAEDRDARDDAAALGGRHGFDRVVAVDAVERIEQLALVLVDALDLRGGGASEGARFPAAHEGAGHAPPSPARRRARACAR